jgi:hypothetical protein
LVQSALEEVAFFKNKHPQFIVQLVMFKPVLQLVTL